MADVNQNNRPLSPHVFIYGWPINAILSIFHRATGAALMLAGILVVWWFIAAASGPEYFQFADDLITSWIGGLIMLGSMAALWFHFFNGIRHLIWDTGALFEQAQVNLGCYLVLGAAAVMTLITWVAAYL